MRRSCIARLHFYWRETKMNIDLLQTILGGLLGGSVIGLVEFLIHRHDERHDRNKEILDKLDLLKEKIDSVSAKGDERAAVSARVRILRFADEMLEERKHSKDSFDQAMSDITFYEQYCESHPEFRNNQTLATVSFIKRNYEERLEKHDFL